jgi:molybdenum cofactor synthesis domain-containing protein
MKPTGSVNVEIIATGDELIYGRILDTNSHWISQRVAELGARLRRVTMIGDEPELIASTLNEALLRDAHFIVVTGGLGPNEDDLTVDSIGLALGKNTVIDEEGARKIEAVYRKRGIIDRPSISRGRRMARILEDSQAMQNPVGFAVGMAVDVGGKTVYREMQRDYPDVYIKNAATPPVEGGDRSKVHTIKVDFVLEAPTLEEAEERMEALIGDYESRIMAVGGGEMHRISPD